MEALYGAWLANGERALDRGNGLIRTAINEFGRSLDADDKIGSLPSVYLRPIECQIHPATSLQARRRQIHYVDTQRRVVSRGVASAPPAITVQCTRALVSVSTRSVLRAGIVRTLVVEAPDYACVSCL